MFFEFPTGEMLTVFHCLIPTGEMLKILFYLSFPQGNVNMLFDSHWGNGNKVDKVKRHFQKKVCLNAGNVNHVNNFGGSLG